MEIKSNNLDWTTKLKRTLLAQQREIHSYYGNYGKSEGLERSSVGLLAANVCGTNTSVRVVGVEDVNPILNSDKEGSS